jgi:hypothetical protein
MDFDKVGFAAPVAVIALWRLGANPQPKNPKT